jgi:hypothetical protein
VSYYRGLAAIIIRSSYELEHGQALTVQDLLERFATEEQQERVLPDDERRRAARLDALTSAIRALVADSAYRRIVCPLAESDLVWGSFVFRFADDESSPIDDRRLAARYRLMPRMAGSLRELSPREFEILCGRVLTIIGCTGITVTQSQRDDGVDAVAELPLAASLREADPSASAFYRIAGDLSFLVYVQAKRNSEENKVRQEKVQELAGSWQAMRNAYFDGTLRASAAAALRRADFRAADPVLMILATTSSFTGGALDKAVSMGMVTLDGEQFAQLLLASEFGLISTGPVSYEVTMASLRAELGEEGGQLGEEGGQLGTGPVPYGDG